MANNELPACYAMVQPGLEDLAGEEITQSLGGTIKRSGNGIVVFRLDDIDRSILQLRTTEDVFLYGWGTDELTYRAKDLESIQNWTDRRVKWDTLLKIHHAVTPKPKAKPTYRLVAQMNGVHGYRRVDALKAMSRGLAGKLPASWKHAEENAAIEIWLTIDGAMAICGMRLSDKTMRHRTYKHEHLPASIRPTVAAAMVRLADLKPGQTVLDPMCGAGTLLAEAFLSTKGKKGADGAAWQLHLVGGDIDTSHVRAAQTNLRQFGVADLPGWDARVAARGRIGRSHSQQSAVRQAAQYPGGDRAAVSPKRARDGPRLASGRQKRADRVGRQAVTRGNRSSRLEARSLCAVAHVGAARGDWRLSESEVPLAQVIHPISSQSSQRPQRLGT